MATTRTDIHRPSSVDFDPEAYDCHGVFDNNTVEGTRREMNAAINAQVNAGRHFGAGSSDQCGHCGARIRYCALLVRQHTNEFIFVGETCLDNRFESLTKGEFQALRKAALLNRERTAKAARTEALLETYPNLVWASYAHNIGMAGGVEIEVDDLYYGPMTEITKNTRWEDRTGMGAKISTLSNIWSKVLHYGDISEAAAKYAIAIVGWLTEADERLVAREAATAAILVAGVQVPTGKTVVEGEVVSTKYVEGYQSWSPSVLKMVVLSDEGWKVYVTVPVAIDSVEKGQRVRFTATLEQSKDDALFGFGKRPSQAKIL